MKERKEGQYRDPPYSNQYLQWIPEFQEYQEDERKESLKKVDKEYKKKIKDLKFPSEVYVTRDEELKKLKEEIGCMKVASISKRKKGSFSLTRTPLNRDLIKEIINSLKIKFPRTYRTRVTDQLIDTILNKLMGTWYSSKDAIVRDVDRIYDEYARFMEASKLDKTLIKLANKLDELELFNLANLVDQAKTAYNENNFDNTLVILKKVGDLLDEVGLYDESNQVTKLIVAASKIEVISFLEGVVKEIKKIDDFKMIQALVIQRVEDSKIKQIYKIGIINHVKEEITTKKDLTKYLYNAILKHQGLAVMPEYYRPKYK